MKLLQFTYLMLLLVGSTHLASAQVDVPPGAEPADTLSSADSTRQVYELRRWEFNYPTGSELVSSDSTLRWQLWPNWVYKKNRDPGVIGYRLGTIGRTNAMLVHAHEPRYQELYWEDYRMNDPVSGTVNWDFIPIHKINSLYSRDAGLQHQTTYFLRQYYLNKPLSHFNYNESKFNTRSLEFMVSRNVGQKTNLEISYWDRRDGGEYDNSEVIGRQVYFRAFHHFDDRQALKVHFLNNKYTVGEPFGYVVPDLNRFAFDRFTARARDATAESETSGSTLAVNYYRRSGDSLETTDNFHAGVVLNTRKRSLDATLDSTYYKVQSAAANMRKWLDLGVLKLEGSLSYERFVSRNPDRSNISLSDWGVLDAGIEGEFAPLNTLKLSMGAGYANRDDGFNSYSLNADGTVSVGKGVKLSLNVSRGTIMPTPQQLYWSSKLYEGSSSLDLERIQEAHAKLSFSPHDHFEVGIRGQIKDIRDAVMVGSDSVFTNVDRYNSVSVTPYFDFESTHFELSGSLVYHRYADYIGNYNQPLPVDDGRRVWLKGSGYVKGYLFDRATYVKAGLSGMISPYSYKAGHYKPVLDYWQPRSNDQKLLWFNRLDVDVSARVRSLMILLKWENVLDDIAQLGYFETANYPMTQRRLVFGLRVLFRN